MKPTQQEMGESNKSMEELFETKLTASISTCNKDGTPWSSTTPYCTIEDKIYIFISSIAEHYHNLMENPKICVMVVQDTCEAPNPFVLLRATFKGEAKKLDDVSDVVWENFNQRFSEELLNRLKSMNFCMFEIPINNGRHVTGFGSAFDVHFKNGIWEKIPVTDVKKRIH